MISPCNRSPVAESGVDFALRVLSSEEWRSRWDRPGRRRKRIPDNDLRSHQSNSLPTADGTPMTRDHAAPGFRLREGWSCTVGPSQLLFRGPMWDLQMGSVSTGRYWRSE